MAKIVELKYRPRQWFMPFHMRAQRWAVLVAHRRAGKTVAVLNDIIDRASYNRLEAPRYGYIAPLYNQAKQIAWQYLKQYTAPFQPKYSESGLYAELPHNGARITLYGADNPDAFRGLYFDGLALDEYGNMRPSTWEEVLLPTLIDRQGWAVFMGTPNGPNHFADLWDIALQDLLRYFTAFLPVSVTKLISEEDLQELRRIMSDEAYQQEFECSFAASTRGAFFAREMAEAEAGGRILNFDCNPRLPMHWALDLGRRDDTTLWGWQELPDRYRIRWSSDANHRNVAFYANLINTLTATAGAPRGVVWLPHDAKAKTLATERSVVEQFVAAKIIPKIVPNLDLMDGIAAARMMIPMCEFHATGTHSGRRALKSYRREYDEDKKSFREAPVHDWASHYADAWRYFSLVSKPGDQLKMLESRIQALQPAASGAHYRFNLNQLFADRENHQKSTRRL